MAELPGFQIDPKEVGDLATPIGDYGSPGLMSAMSGSTGLSGSTRTGGTTESPIETVLDRGKQDELLALQERRRRVAREMTSLVELEWSGG